MNAYQQIHELKKELAVLQSRVALAENIVVREAKPTPAPEPPNSKMCQKCLEDNGGSGDDVICPVGGPVAEGESCPEFKPVQAIQPQASQPLPAEVESAVKHTEESILREAVYSNREKDKKAREACMYLQLLKERLAALWPKAGQVPSVEDYKQALKEDAADLWRVTNAIKKEIEARIWITEGRGSYAYDDDQYRTEAKQAFDAISKLIEGVQDPAQKRFHALMHASRAVPPSPLKPAPLPPQSELDKCAADELRRIEAKAKGDQYLPLSDGTSMQSLALIIRQHVYPLLHYIPDDCWAAAKEIISSLRTVQPSPVTAEKLADEMMRYCTQARDIPFRWDKFAEHVLKAFPTLGQGRLTRDDPRVKVAVEKFLREANYSPGPLFRTLITDLLALQGPMKVSRGQWEKLLAMCNLGAGRDLLPSQVKAWLKAELGMEVADD